ncbi:MAG TPA: response regulator transcription factor [Edaphocola sp.]|nr:response regulator transcription factor [Edaphocola sp.]
MAENLGNILLVDDEPDILEMVSFNLRQAGYETQTAQNGEEAIFLANKFSPDLILLDVMMPEMDGYETIQQLRKNPKLDKTIIIFLTALSDERSEIEGLKLGADDYITKPIKMNLLRARLATALRRIKKDEEQDNKLVFGDLEINAYKFTVSYRGKEITLAKKEFELLSMLASRPGRVFLRAEILQKVWGTDVIVGDRTIDVHIRKIRQKTGVDMIRTVKGVGYKFEMPE